MCAQQIQVLLVEDNPGDVLLIQTLLSSTTVGNFIVNTASCLKDTFVLFEAKLPDVTRQ
jgi:hypothetical protein